MKKYTISCECEMSRTYEIVADNEEEALDIAERKFIEDDLDYGIYIEDEKEC